MKTKILATLISSVCLGLAAGPTTDAFAASRFMHASSCWPNPSFARYTSTEGAQLYNPSTHTEAHLFCPFNSDDVLRAKNATQVTVDVYANGNFTYGGAEAQSCITYAGGGGGNCDEAIGGFVKAGSAGVRHLPIAPWAWQSGTTADYPYVWIILAPMSGGSANVVFGYNVTN